MSMLAEPRQKTRYTLTPKGKPLFEDNDRFGTKMLEKMGWSKGKGLGRGEDGNQEFVRVKYKRDGNGLGFESRDDQWTEHEKHFSGLLDNLNGDSDSKNNSVTDDCEDITPPTAGLGFASSDTSSKKKLKDKFSGQSLEEKSKNSKARVHYKKFTKGKDMAQYSEKDLANIFGRKATPEDTNIYNQFQAFNANGSESDGKEESTVQETPEQSGSSIINTGVSVNDYFKMKIAALKEKQGLTSSMNPFQSNTRIVNGVEVFVPLQRRNSAEENEVTKTEEEEVPRKKKKKSKKQCDVAESEPTAAAEEDSSQEKSARKKKKSKKLVESIEEQAELLEEEKTNQDETMEPISESKNKIKKPTEEEISESNAKEESDNQQKKKNKKSKKRSREDLENEEQTEMGCVPVVEDEIPKKKKKDKKKSADEIDSTPEAEGNQQCVVPIKKKKSKKCLQDPEVEVSTRPVQEEDEAPADTTPTQDTTIKPKKSKKKNNTSTTTPLMPLTQTKEQVSSHHSNLNNPLTDRHSYLFDTLTISTFCAEKFRNVDIDKFKGTNLMDFTGYGLKEDIQLNVKNSTHDVERIMKLWNGTLDKYTTHSTSTRKLYNSYNRKLIQARKTKTVLPKFKFNILKRKDVFQGM